MVPVGRITHKMPGRLRVKVLPRKSDRDYFTSLAGELLKVPGVSNVETNPLTGSVLILHETEPRKIIDYANENGLFRILLENNHGNSGAASQNPRRLTLRIADVFRQTDSKMLEATGGQIDIGGAAFLALVGVGVYQIARGNFMALPWYAAFWYALNIFLKALPAEGPALGTVPDNRHS